MKKPFANTGQMIYGYMVNDGLNLREIAEEFGVDVRTLRRWMEDPKVREHYDRALASLSPRDFDAVDARIERNDRWFGNVGASLIGVSIDDYFERGR